ncbi:nitroreductase family protein [Halioxenophilus aromaticivorans]|uniref:Nitroreductase family protein n=1 Tax=Halioxenophilus aromaticivorans TaxID=1306992 RepID=A0AAV3U954_9ALTE
MSEFATGREALAGVDPLFVDRWSPRALSNEPIDDAALQRIFEAARWAPSAYNEQPWTFYTSTSDTFASYLGMLVEGNQSWAKDAAIIGFLIGKKHLSKNGNDNGTYQLDCGAAWMSMSLQARLEGLYTHAMAGIKRDQVIDTLGLDPAQYSAVMGFTLAKLRAPEQLPAGLQARETPSDRKPLDEIWRR